jgi:Ser/Thr protein kinase RdoA (MazF antagonist)
MNASALAADVARRFGLVAADVVALGDGHINDTFLVAAGAVGRFVLQRLNPRVFPDPLAVLANSAAVSAHLRARLAAAGLPDLDRRAPAPLEGRDGRPWAVDPDGGCWRGYRFVEGARPASARGSHAEAFAAARALGTFVALLADGVAPRLRETLPGFHDTAARFRQLESVVSADPLGRRAAAAREIDALRARRAFADALAGGLPLRVVHNDAKLDNVLLDSASGEALAVIDLDTVMPGLAAWDFGDLVRSGAAPAAEDDPDPSHVELDPGRFDALAAGWIAGARPVLTADEAGSLVTGALVITCEQAARFLADFLSGDVYYKVARPDHNLDRTRTQLALLASLERAQLELRRRCAAHFAETCP